MKLTIWTAAVLAIALFAAHSGAVNTGQIHGRVIDVTTQVPIGGATVIVEGTGLTAKTTEDGTFTILNVPAGAYIVRVEKSGVRSTLLRVTVVANQTATANFKLAIAGAKAPAATPLQGKDAVKERAEESAATRKAITLGRSDANAPAPSDALETRGMRSSGDALEGKFKAQSNGAASPTMRYQPPQTFRPYSPTPDNESYDNIVENDWLATLDKPLSTFSVDVDAASYSNMRRFITQGQLPPVDAVRIEELINYFDYDYPNPRGQHPFSITTEVSDAPWNPAHKLVHIGIQGKRLDLEELPPANLVFLIDVSGSMNSPDKLPLLKDSFRMLVEQLREDDFVSIVVYAGAAGLVLPPTLGSNKDDILCAIDRLEAGGSTAGAAGIQLAYQVAQRHFIRGGNNRVVLATDGDFNVGVSSDGELVRLIEEKRRGGVFLTVLGFGQGNLKDSKMEKLADAGNGHYAYIDNLAEGQKVMVNEMGATLLTIAKDVKLQVEFNPARVAWYRLVGYENRALQDRDFDDDRKDAGDIGAGHSVTALYEIELTTRDTNRGRPQRYSKVLIDKDAMRNPELLTVSFRYKQPNETQSRLLSVPVKDRNVRFARASENFRFSAAVAEFGMLLRDSEQKGFATMEHVIETARGACGEDEHGYRSEFVALAEMAESLMRPEVGVRY